MGRPVTIMCCTLEFLGLNGGLKRSEPQVFEVTSEATDIFFVCALDITKDGWNKLAREADIFAVASVQKTS